MINLQVSLHSIILLNFCSNLAHIVYSLFILYITTEVMVFFNIFNLLYYSHIPLSFFTSSNFIYISPYYVLLCTFHFFKSIITWNRYVIKNKIQNFIICK